MTSTSIPTKTIALIHNTNLERPLNVLSTAIAEDAKRTYFAPNIPSEYQIEIIDLADYNLPPTITDVNSPPKSSNETSKLKTSTEWQVEMTKHSGLILLFPYHTWSRCTPLKDALSILPPHLIHKPALMLGFGKEELRHPKGCINPWQRRAFGMMEEFLLERGVKLVDMNKQLPGALLTAGWPEFMIYADYWDDWITGGPNGFISGQQAEIWESSAWNRCQKGVVLMVEEIAKKSRK